MLKNFLNFDLNLAKLFVVWKEKITQLASFNVGKKRGAGYRSENEEGEKHNPCSQSVLFMCDITHQLKGPTKNSRNLSQPTSIQVLFY